MSGTAVFELRQERGNGPKLNAATFNTRTPTHPRLASRPRKRKHSLAERGLGARMDSGSELVEGEGAWCAWPCIETHDHVHYVNQAWVLIVWDGESFAA